LTMANELCFLRADGHVSLAGFDLFCRIAALAAAGVESQALGPFLATGVCETTSILLIITAISMAARHRRADRRELSGLVVDPVSHLSADVESVNGKVIAGILSVVGEILRFIWEDD